MTFEQFLEEYTTVLREAEEESQERLQEVREVLYADWWERYGLPQQKHEEARNRSQGMLRAAMELIGGNINESLLAAQNRVQKAVNGNIVMTETEANDIADLVAIHAPNEYQEWENNWM